MPDAETTPMFPEPACGAAAACSSISVDCPRPLRGTDKHMNDRFEQRPYIGLVDDDDHSAHLFMRMLAANDGPSVRHYGDDAKSLAELSQALKDPLAHWPDILVVDLKSHSNANLEFVRRYQACLHQKGIGVVVMIPPVSRAVRMMYHEAGAAAVFFRQPELDAYRRELAALTDFWARSRRPDAVGM